MSTEHHPRRRRAMPQWDGHDVIKMDVPDAQQTWDAPKSASKTTRWVQPPEGRALTPTEESNIKWADRIYKKLDEKKKREKSE